MYTFKRKLVKAQGGRNISETDSVVREGKFTLPDYNNTRISIQQPTTPQYTEIDENDVISDIKQGAKQLVTKGKNWLNERQERMQDKRDERNAPYQEQLDDIDESKSNTKGYRGQLKELRKSNRLSDKYDNKKLKEKELERRLKMATELDKKTDSQRTLDYNSDLTNQTTNQNRRYTNRQYNQQTGATRENNRNEVRNARSDVDFQLNELEKAIAAGNYTRAAEIKKNLTLESIKQGSSSRRNDIYKNALEQKKNTDKRYNLIDPNSKNYYDPSVDEKILKELNYKPFPRLDDGESEEIDEDDVMLDNEGKTENIKGFPAVRKAIEENKKNGLVKYPYFPPNESEKPTLFPYIIKKGEPVEKPTLFSMPASKDDETEYGTYQDGGDLNESDFDYTEDIDLNELMNRYFRGGMLPKAQDGLGVPPKVPQPTQAELDAWQKRTGEDNNNYYMDNEGNALGQLGTISEMDYTPFMNKDKTIVPVATEANRFSSPYLLNNPVVNKYVDKTNFGPEITTSSTDSSTYDPWQLREPGNIIQQRANLGPMMYNAGRFLDRIDKAKTYHTPPTLRRESVTPDYTAANEAANATAAALRENSRSPQGYLATSISANMNLAKQKNAIANEATKQNIQYRQNYLGQVNANKAIKDQKQQAAYQQDQRNRVTRDEYGVSFVEDVRKYQQDKGEFLNKEREDRIRRDTYLNKIAKDYQFKELPNGDYEIVMNGRKVSMTPEAFAETIENDKAKAQATTDAEVKAKYDKLAAEQTAEIARLKKEKEELEANKNKSTGTGAGAGAGGMGRKFGGWLKEQSQHTKKRNRLYL